MGNDLIIGCFYIGNVWEVVVGIKMLVVSFVLRILLFEYWGKRNILIIYVEIFYVCLIFFMV